MTTKIDDILFDKYDETDEESAPLDGLDREDLQKKVTDLSRALNKRIAAFEKYYDLYGDDIIEITNLLTSMYQVSGISAIEQFFYKVCTHSNVSSFIKLESAKNILDYENFSDEKASITQNRKDLGYKALDFVCYDLSTLSTPCRVEAIIRLMGSENYKINANSYFKEFVRDENIDCDFKYKSILSLENVSADIIRKKIFPLFSDKNFVKSIYENFSVRIGKIFPKMKPKMTETFWNQLVCRFTYDDLRQIFTQKFPDETCGLDFFICEAQLAFLFCEKNDIVYRILSGQYLLQKCELNNTKLFKVENQIYEFAKNKENDYDRRADAADVLLRLGSDSMKSHGRDMIMELGRVNGNTRTVFDNAQNVHTEEVEESVTEALEFLSNIDLVKINGKDIDFDHVNTEIENMLKEDMESMYIEGNNTTECSYCKSRIELTVNNDNKKFCGNDCLRLYYRDEKIRLAMNRIFMDRALYSKFNSSLINILIKVWSFIVSSEHEDEMRKRILEELEEMSGTCSSGFATRLINVISGFGNVNIRISWEDQVIANFSGRLNAYARKLSEDSVFRDEKFMQVIKIWFQVHEDVLKDITKQIESSVQITMEQVIQVYLNKYGEKKKDEILEEFCESVINEMTMTSSGYENRRNFSLFFNTYVSKIREELYQEFKEHISDGDFDLYFRKALMSYEGF